jgi:hypothetical protein
MKEKKLLSSIELLDKVSNAIEEVYYFKYVLLYRHFRKTGVSKKEARNISISLIKSFIMKTGNIANLFKNKGFDLQIILEEVLQ